MAGQREAGTAVHAASGKGPEVVCAILLTSQVPAPGPEDVLFDAVISFQHAPLT